MSNHVCFNSVTFFNFFNSELVRNGDSGAVVYKTAEFLKV